MPARHEGSSQLHKCLVVDLVFGFVFDFVFVVGGGPRRGVFFFSVPFLLDKQKKRYDLRLYDFKTL